jgi:hypothetical protein
MRFEESFGMNLLKKLLYKRRTYSFRILTLWSPTCSLCSPSFKMFPLCFQSESDIVYTTFIRHKDRLWEKNTNCVDTRKCELTHQDTALTHHDTWHRSMGSNTTPNHVGVNVETFNLWGYKCTGFLLLVVLHAVWKCANWVRLFCLQRTRFTKTIGTTEASVLCEWTPHIRRWWPTRCCSIRHNGLYFVEFMPV